VGKLNGLPNQGWCKSHSVSASLESPWRRPASNEDFLMGAKHYSVNTRQEAEHKLQSHSAIPPTLKSNSRGHSIM